MERICELGPPRVRPEGDGGLGGHQPGGSGRGGPAELYREQADELAIGAGGKRVEEQAARRGDQIGLRESAEHFSGRGDAAEGESGAASGARGSGACATRSRRPGRNCTVSRRRSCDWRERAKRAEECRRGQRRPRSATGSGNRDAAPYGGRGAARRGIGRRGDEGYG